MFKQLIARPAVYSAILLASIGVGTTTSQAAAPPPSDNDLVATDLVATDLVATTTLDASGVWRGVLGRTPEILHLELPAAGIATLEVSTPRVDLNPIRLDLLSPGGLASAKVLEQSATRIVLATRHGGSWWLKVAARDSGRYKVITTFAPARILDEHFELEPRAGSEPLQARRTSFYALEELAPFKNEPEVIDPDPDTAMGDSNRLLARFWRLTSSLPPQKNEPEVIDPDPDTATAPAIEMDRVIRYQIPCLAADRSDDHGDTPSCATPLRLGERVTGTVESWSGDDADVFTLTLTEVATLEIDVDEDGSEAVSTIIADLNDCAGRRLATDLRPPASSLGDRSLVATLGPGRYCVRVEGDAASTDYSLEVISRTP